MQELNRAIAAPGSLEILEDTGKKLKKGEIPIFSGDYVGVDPDDPSDTWDLNNEYPENAEASYPSFHYVLKDVIEVESD